MESVDSENSQAVAVSGATQGQACAVVLSGGLRPSPLMQETGCATLDLSITPTQTVADIWRSRLEEVLEIDQIWIVPSGSCPKPQATSKMQLAEEPDGYRGPGGVVRDMSLKLGTGTILVVEAARYLDASFAPLMRRHTESGAMATVGMNSDGSPAGIYAISREAVALVPARGFMDLKEQWLPLIREQGRVEVVQIEGRGAMPLQTRQDFLNAAGWLACGRKATELVDSIWWSADSTGWSIAARDATVEEGAFVEYSVLQPGAVVRSGAIVARSIVCAGAVVETNARVVDRTIPSPTRALTTKGADS